MQDNSNKTYKIYGDWSKAVLNSKNINNSIVQDSNDYNKLPLENSNFTKNTYNKNETKNVLTKLLSNENPFSLKDTRAILREFLKILTGKNNEIKADRAFDILLTTISEGLGIEKGEIEPEKLVNEIFKSAQTGKTDNITSAFQKANPEKLVVQGANGSISIIGQEQKSGEWVNLINVQRQQQAHQQNSVC